MRQRSSLGSIKQLPDRRYKVTVTIGYVYDENGKKKQKRHSKIVKSMKEARELIRKYDSSVEKTISVKDYIDEYIKNMASKESSKNVAEKVLKRHLLPLHNRLMNQVKGYEIDRILDSMDYAETTMLEYSNIFRSFFRRAESDGYIKAIPDFKTRGSKRKTKTMKILPTMDDMDTILRLARERYENRDTCPYLYHMLLLILSTGIRVGELCVLKWKNIDFKRYTITINATASKYATGSYRDSPQPKTTSSIRIIPVAKETLDIINKEVPRKCDYVFPGTPPKFILPVTISRYARRVFDLCGFPKLRVYDLRHIHATELIANGVDVKSVSHRLGHINTSTTLNTYTHYVSDNDRQAAELMGNMIFKKCLKEEDTP